MSIHTTSNTTAYNTFKKKFYGIENAQINSWTTEENPFSDPQTRAIECLKKIDQHLFHGEVEKADALFQKCKEKEAWNADIGIKNDSPFRNLQNIQIACDRIHTNTAQILKAAKEKQEDAKEKQTLEQIKANIQELTKEKQDPTKAINVKIYRKIDELKTNELVLEHRIKKRKKKHENQRNNDNKKRIKLDEIVSTDRLYRDPKLNSLEMYNYFFITELPSHLHLWFFSNLHYK